MSDLTLEALGAKYNADKRVCGYLDFYEEVFSELNIRSFMEIGVYRGGSLRMWREFFPERTTIVGVDVLDMPYIPGCITLKTDATTEEFADMVGRYDCILDDGGHKVSQQRKSFENLWPHIREGGIYVIEDICTSFRKHYIDERPTMYEYITKFCKDNNIKYREFRKTGEPGYEPGTFILYK